MNWNEILHQVIYPAILTGLSGLFTWFVAHGVKWLKAKANEALQNEKNTKHARAMGVLTDTFFEVAVTMGKKLSEILADGKITDVEKSEFKQLWKKECKEKLENLSGFAKDELDAWLDKQFKVVLGKLLTQML